MIHKIFTDGYVDLTKLVFLSDAYFIKGRHYSDSCVGFHMNFQLMDKPLCYVWCIENTNYPADTIIKSVEFEASFHGIFYLKTDDGWQNHFLCDNGDMILCEKFFDSWENSPKFKIKLFAESGLQKEIDKIRIAWEECKKLHPNTIVKI